MKPGPGGPGQKPLALKNEGKIEEEEEGGDLRGVAPPRSDSVDAGLTDEEEPHPFGQPSLPHGHMTPEGGAGVEVEEGGGGGGEEAGGFVVVEGWGGVVACGGGSVGKGSGADTGVVDVEPTPPRLAVVALVSDPCGAPLTDPPSVGGSVPGPSNLAVPGTRCHSGL